MVAERCAARRPGTGSGLQTDSSAPHPGSRCRWDALALWAVSGPRSIVGDSPTTSEEALRWVVAGGTVPWVANLGSTGAAPRTLAERRAAAAGQLDDNHHMWLASGSDGHGAHLIPVSYTWDGRRLTTATFVRSRTASNVRAHPMVRASIGTTTDVLMIDATARLVGVQEIDENAADAYARMSLDPRTVPGFVYLYLEPRRMQVWRGADEFTGRTVMRGGVWLDEPVD